MRIIALLSMYDEPVAFLVDLVASLAAAGVDHVVAVDGAYALYPEGKPHSPSEQTQAVLAGCQGAGMGCSIHLPQDIWAGNEIEKRDFLFAAGHLIATPRADWLWIVDGDEVITEALGLREALEGVTEDVVEFMMDTRSFEGPEGSQPFRKLFRAQAAGIWLQHNHFTYQTVVDGVTRTLFRGGENAGCVRAATMHQIRLAHRPMRSDARKMQRQLYYDRRKAAGVELVPA